MVWYTWDKWRFAKTNAVDADLPLAADYALLAREWLTAYLLVGILSLATMFLVIVAFNWLIPRIRRVHHVLPSIVFGVPESSRLRWVRLQTILETPFGWSVTAVILGGLAVLLLARYLIIGLESFSELIEFTSWSLIALFLVVNIAWIVFIVYLRSYRRPKSRRAIDFYLFSPVAWGLRATSSLSLIAVVGLFVGLAITSVFETNRAVSVGAAEVLANQRNYSERWLRLDEGRVDTSDENRRLGLLPHPDDLSRSFGVSRSVDERESIDRFISEARLLGWRLVVAYAVLTLAFPMVLSFILVPSRRRMWVQITLATLGLVLLSSGLEWFVEVTFQQNMRGLPSAGLIILVFLSIIQRRSRISGRHHMK